MRPDVRNRPRGMKLVLTRTTGSVRGNDESRRPEKPFGPVEHATAPAPPPPPAVVEIVTATGVDVDTRLAALCGIPTSKVFFTFDSAQVTAGGAQVLDDLATCATTGAAKGHELRVIGRTDPRGTDTYNEELGTSRAEAVANYLRSKGIRSARVDVLSKGEEDASPVAFDRRVTVRLGG